jgi:hypothetical protein
MAYKEERSVWFQHKNMSLKYVRENDKLTAKEMEAMFNTGKTLKRMTY